LDAKNAASHQRSRAVNYCKMPSVAGTAALHIEDPTAVA